MFGNIKFNRLLLLIGGALTIFVLGAAIISSLALERLRVGGPIYTEIVLGKDLIADILPPPEYVIEAYLEATLALGDPTTVPQRKERLAQLHKDYDTRLEYWKGQEFDKELKRLLIQESDPHVARFWKEIEQGLLPALARGDIEAANSHYRTIQSNYASHRRVIDQVVENTTKLNAIVEANAAEEQSFFQTAFFLVQFLTLALVGGAVWAMRKGMVKPLSEMAQTMSRVAGGDLTAEVDGIHRKDEVGDFARALQVFKQNKIAADGMTNEVSEALGATTAAVQQLGETAKSLSATATQTSSQSQAVSAASEQTSANVNSVASAADELTASVEEISRQVADAAKVAAKATEDAQRTDLIVQKLSDFAKNISNVVTLINNIASQTNLLALNATIESARAGDAGKGFAVVANQVKALANQTAKATDEISSQVTSMQTITDEAVASIRSIIAVIENINQISSAISGAVQEQGSATKEIARSAEQAAAGTKEVATNIDGVNRSASQTGESAQHVMKAAATLNASSQALKQKLDAFLRRTRAA